MAAAEKYRFDARLGGGGMAEVFAGTAVGAAGFSRKVAIKRVLPGFSEDPMFAQMFVAEAQISAQLVHPNIVSVLDFDRDAEARLFLVMELVEGRDLAALAATGLLPYPVIAYAIIEVLRGLGYAHELPAGAELRGVIHRDVSPHNVLVSWEGAVKVSDFGIAKVRASSEATASLHLKGKPAYMSPEQANGKALDGRSDLFAVGVMLWELLVGRRLFIGEDTRATLGAVLFGPIPLPRDLRPEVPKDLERVAMKLLERDLGARYRTAAAAIADLEACGDATGDGRDAMIAILGERFASAAPVRKNRARAPGAVAVPTPSHLATTIPAGATVPHSLGVARAAPTAIAGSRTGRRVVVITLLLGISGASAYLISRRGADATGGTPRDAGGIDGVIDAPVGAASARKDATISSAMHSGTP